MNHPHPAFCSFLLFLGACASQPAQLSLPASLVPAGEQSVEKIAARGVQIYECRAMPGDATAAWALVRGEAALLDLQGKTAGRHLYAGGPAWEAPDGSKFIGSVKARADAPEKGALPWLLLSTRSIGGEGRFSKITSLQRVNTAGGVAPGSRCDMKSVGATERVPFTADYVLFAK